jgi:hypothetical protein
MPNGKKSTFNRRGLLTASAAMLGGTVLNGAAKAEPEPYFRNVNTN